MRKSILSLAMAALLVPALAQASQPGKGSFALSVLDSGGDQGTVAGAVGNTVGGFGYTAGYFLTDGIMPYGTFRLVNSGGDSGVLIGGGSRFYALPGDRGGLRTFAAGEMNILSASDVVGDDAFGIGGYFGMEYHFSENFSLMGRVGLEFVSWDVQDSSMSIGSTQWGLNWYM